MAKLFATPLLFVVLVTVAWTFGANTDRAGSSDVNQVNDDSSPAFSLIKEYAKHCGQGTTSQQNPPACRSFIHTQVEIVKQKLSSAFSSFFSVLPSKGLGADTHPGYCANRHGESGEDGWTKRCGGENKPLPLDCYYHLFLNRWMCKTYGVKEVEDAFRKCCIDAGYNYDEY